MVADRAGPGRILKVGFFFLSFFFLMLFVLKKFETQQVPAVMSLLTLY